jgi:hypothetical protein
MTQVHWLRCRETVVGDHAIEYGPRRWHRRRRGSAMATYVIDATRGLWRVDRDAPEDWNNVAVERPACSQCGHRETAKLPFDEVVVDPTDQELAELEPEELARFGITRARLLG